MTTAARWATAMLLAGTAGLGLTIHTAIQRAQFNDCLGQWQSVRLCHALVLGDEMPRQVDMRRRVAD